MEAVADFRATQAALRLWWRDFERLIEYVEPIDEHAFVHSHRLFELLLRAATEFESLAKVYATHSGATIPKHSTIKNYRDLLMPLRIAEVAVGIQQWRPRARYVAPFEAWTTSSDSPSWYRAYNAVKHSRREQFAEASLLHAVSAAGAVFATLLMAYDMPLWPAVPQRIPGHPTPATVDLQFQDAPFTLRVPWGAV